MSPKTTPKAPMTRICVFSVSLWPILLRISALIRHGLDLRPLFLFLSPLPPHRGRLHARRLLQAIDGLLGFGGGLKTRQLHHLAEETDRIIHRDGFQVDDQIIKGGVPPV